MQGISGEALGMKVLSTLMYNGPMESVGHSQGLSVAAPGISGGAIWIVGD